MSKRKSTDKTTTIRDRAPPEVAAAYKEMMGAERRVWPRAEVRIGVRLDSEAKLAEAYTAYTANIGHGGVCLLTKMEYPLGHTLKLRLEIDGHEPIRVDGTVAWVRPSIAIGVRFVDVTPEAQKTIDDLVQRHLKSREP